MGLRRRYSPCPGWSCITRAVVLPLPGFWGCGNDITARQTFEREIRPLKAIKDNYKKLILTADQNTLGNYDGIEVINLLEWLLKTK